MGRPAKPRRLPAEIASPGTIAAVHHALGIDRVVHERMRLAMVSALALTDSLGFAELKELLGATDGNLIVHARRLEDAGYISCTKITEGRTSRTIYRLTPAGRAAVRRYLDRIEDLAAALGRSDRRNSEGGARSAE